MNDNIVVQEILTDPVIDVLVVWTNNIDNNPPFPEIVAEGAVDGVNMTFGSGELIKFSTGPNPTKHTVAWQWATRLGMT